MVFIKLTFYRFVATLEGGGQQQKNLTYITDFLFIRMNAVGMTYTSYSMIGFHSFTFNHLENKFHLEIL